MNKQTVGRPGTVKVKDHSSTLRSSQGNQIMDPKGKAMIQGWIKMHRGDLEGVARYIAYSLHVCGIREARKIIADASGIDLPRNYIASVS